jgi:hypothetical protein
MLGTHGMWEDGWKAVAVHAPLTGKGHFDKDPWQLYHVDVDRAESMDVAKDHPEKLQALIKTWFEEAEKNNVRLYYVYNFLGIKPQQQFVSPELKPGKYTLGMEFIRESAGKFGESIGRTRLYVNDTVAAEGPMRTQPGKFTLSGDGLCIGRDSGDNISQEYKAPGTFNGGRILAVGVNVGKQEYHDLDRAAAALFAAE